jgi:hypothetical protein
LDQLHRMYLTMVFTEAEKGCYPQYPEPGNAIGKEDEKRPSSSTRSGEQNGDRRG